MTPSEARQWQRVFRELLATAVGTFMLVYETVGTTTPNEWIIGGGLTAIGLVPALRFDDSRKKSNGAAASSNGGDHEDRWSHLS